MAAYLLLISLTRDVSFAYLLTRHAPLAVLALWHVGGTGAAWLVCRTGDREHPLLAARFALLGFCFPLGGLLGAWLATPWRPATSPMVLEHYRANLSFSPRPRRLGVVADAEEAMRRELSVRPHLSQIRSGSLPAKQAAMSSLTQMSGPDGVRILRTVLGDPDLETRLFASLGLMRVEERYGAELKTRRSHVEALPFDLEARMQLAKAIYEYLLSGLPTGAGALSLWQELADAMTLVLGQAPQGAMAYQAWLYRAAAHLANDQPEEARQAVSRARQIAPGGPEAIYLECEALYGLGDFDGLARTARTLMPLAQAGTPEWDVVRWWGHHAS